MPGTTWICMLLTKPLWNIPSTESVAVYILQRTYIQNLSKDWSALEKLRDPLAADWPRDTWNSFMGLALRCTSRTKKKRPEMKEVFYMPLVNRPANQIPHCTSPTSRNAPFCNRNVHMCTFLLQNGALCDIYLMHCGISKIVLFIVA